MDTIQAFHAQKSAPQKWVISQQWHDVLFLNYRAEADLLKEVLPSHLELDTFRAQAYVSVVPFRMSGIRFPFTPSLPFSSLWELNLRTYVRYDGTPGIYFFTLDTDHVLAQWIAKNFFHLPYRVANLRGHVDKTTYRFEAGKSLKLLAKLTDVPLVTSDYHEWMVERYCLYADKQTEKGVQLWRGDVVHKAWPLNFAKLEHLEEGLCHEFFPQGSFELESTFFARHLPVYFKPFKRVL